MNFYDESLLKDKKHIHFIGIGGSGMFPIVQILHAEGFYITGSDNNETETIKIEREMGIEIFMGQRAENIKGADLIVYTAAIMADNPELIAAKESGVDTIERSVMLGLITRRYDRAICISGTHGKTTTSAMLTQILVESEMDPTAVIGGKLPLIHGSGIAGKSDIMVCESCEFVDTFLKLSPNIAVILNVDEDHLDYFKNLDNIIRSFNAFAKMADKCIIANGDDENTMRAVADIKAVPIVTFGYGKHNDYYVENIEQHKGIGTSFDLVFKGERLCRLTMNVPGEHNILNTVAACVAALQVKTPIERIEKSVPNFRGAGRRFEVLGKVNGFTVADDYAHHPKELEVTLKTAKKLDFNRVWAVFQPFTYSRTAILFDDFVKALTIADKVVLSEIMGSREKNTYNIYSKDLAEKIDGCVWFNTFEEIANYVLENAEEGDLVITLGCGDIYKCAKMMLENK